MLLLPVKKFSSLRDAAQFILDTMISNMAFDLNTFGVLDVRDIETRLTSARLALEQNDKAAGITSVAFEVWQQGTKHLKNRYYPRRLVFPIMFDVRGIMIKSYDLESLDVGIVHRSLAAPEIQRWIERKRRLEGLAE